MNKEEWRDIANYPLYEVSSLGRVRNARNKNILANVPHNTGYPVVTLYAGSKDRQKRTRRRQEFVHILVCRAFHGNPLPGQEVAHADGDRVNPRADNVRWDTRKGNHADCIEHGTAPIGEQNPRARLSEFEVRAIREDRRSRKEIAAEYGLAVEYITRIRSRETWKHVI